MFASKNPILIRRLSLLTLAIFLFTIAAPLAPQKALAGASAAAASLQSGPGKRAVVRGHGAELYAQPGGEISEVLPLATAVMVTGRTADSQWLEMYVVDGPEGWVYAGDVVLFGIDQIPIKGVEVLDINPPDVPVSVEPPETVAEEDDSPEGSSLPANENTGSATRSAPGAAQIATVSTPSRGLNVRTGPNINNGIITSLPKGTELTALARNARNTWIQIELPRDPDEIGWVSASLVELNGNSEDLPVSDRKSKAASTPARNTAAGSSTGNSGLDGTLVFQDYPGGKIYVHTLNNGNTRELTTGMDPALSPDGKTVAFLRDVGEGIGLYTIGIDGSNERRHYREPKLRSTAWSPDGDRIAFSRVTGYSYCRSVGFGVCIPDKPWLGDFRKVRVDQRGLARINAEGDGFKDIPAVQSALAPDWGLGGIIYQSQNGLEVTDDYEGADTRSFAPDYRYQDPAWNPEASKVAFFSAEKDHNEIFLMNSDRSGLAALTRPPTYSIDEPVHNVAPVWSPDGDKIMFVSNRSGEWSFYVMNPDGSNVKRVDVGVPIDYRFQFEQIVDWGA